MIHDVPDYPQEDASSDPGHIMADAPPGTLVYAVASDGEGPVQIEVLIRESEDVLAQLPGRPELAMRAGVVTTRKIPVPVVLFRFAAGLPVYASFWNYYHPTAPGEPNALECMDTEPREIIFKLFGEAGTVASLFVCKHPLGGFFRNACTQAADLPPWSEEEFYEALDDVFRQFPDPASLWDAFIREAD